MGSASGYGMRGQAAASLAKGSSEPSLARGQKTTRKHAAECGSAGLVEACLAGPKTQGSRLAGGSLAGLRGCGSLGQVSLVSPVRARRVIPCGPPLCSLRARQTKRLRAAIGRPPGASARITHLLSTDSARGAGARVCLWDVIGPSVWPPLAPRRDAHGTAGRETRESRKHTRGGLPDGPRKLLARALEAASGRQPSARGCGLAAPSWLRAG